jgi:hypothetical protein
MAALTTTRTKTNSLLTFTASSGLDHRTLRLAAFPDLDGHSCTTSQKLRERGCFQIAGTAKSAEKGESPQSF